LIAKVEKPKGLIRQSQRSQIAMMMGKEALLVVVDDQMLLLVPMSLLELLVLS
jgi:hypothetical protein